MKIKRFKANGFGVLQREIRFNPDKVTLIVENNERGKSTLVEGIFAGLYGFPPREIKSKSKLTMAERFNPMGCDTYEIELEIESDGKSFVIKRDFENGDVFVYDALTGKDVKDNFYKSKNYYPVGEFVLGIPEDVFKKTALVQQHEIQSVKDSISIQDAVQRMVGTSSGDTSAVEAIDVLYQSLNDFYSTTSKSKTRRMKVDTELKNLQERIKEIDIELENLDKKRDEVDLEIDRLESINSQEQELEEEIKKLNYLIKQSEYINLKRRLEENDNRTNELESYIKKRESLKDIAGFSADKYGDLLKMQGQCAELEKESVRAAEELKDVENDFQDNERNLMRYEEFRDFTREEMQEMGINVSKFKDAEKKLNGKTDRFNLEKEKITQNGFNLHEYEKLKEIFDTVSDEDKDFIGEFRELELKNRNGLKDIVSGIEDIKEEIAGIINRRKKKKRIGLIAGVLSSLLVISGILFLPLNIFILLAGIAGLVYGVVTVKTSDSLQSDRYIELKRRNEDETEKQKILESEGNELENKIKHICKKYEYEQQDELIEDFKEYKRLDGRTDTLNRMDGDIREIKKEREEIKDTIVQYVKKTREDIQNDGITQSFCERFMDNVKHYFSLIDERDTLSGKIKEKSELAEYKLTEKGKIEEELFAILVESGIEREDGIERGITKYKEKLAVYQEFIKLRDELIPETEKSLFNNPDIDIINAKIRYKKNEMKDMIKQYPHFTRYKVEKDRDEYEREASEKEKMLKNIENKRTELSEAVSVINEYRKKYPELQKERFDLIDTFDKTEKFKKSVERALEVLEKISTESHSDWAGVLNTNVSSIIGKIAPQYRDIKFDNNKAQRQYIRGSKAFEKAKKENKNK